MKKHWTPRYILNRIKNYSFEKNNPNLPWINPDAINIFKDLLTSDDVGVEFGSGKSTVWFSKRVKKLTSIEDNQVWFNKIKEEIALKSNKNVDYLFRVTNDSNPLESDYCKSIESFEDESLDFVIVDGKHRDFFALKSISKIKKTGFIFLDDANRYLPRQTHSPHSINNNIEKLTDNWMQFEDEISTWRKIWTTNGVSDAAFFIKK